MVEELLELFVAEVDADLFKSIVLQKLGIIKPLKTVSSTNIAARANARARIRSLINENTMDVYNMNI